MEDEQYWTRNTAGVLMESKYSGLGQEMCFNSSRTELMSL